MGTSLSRIVLENRGLVSGVVAAGVWAVSRSLAPLPDDNPVLVLILNAKPYIHKAISAAYTAMWFTTPFIVSSLLLSFAYIFLMRRGSRIGRISLAAYPDPAKRTELFVVVGEVHKHRTFGPVAQPKWRTIPERWHPRKGWTCRSSCGLRGGRLHIALPMNPDRSFLTLVVPSAPWSVGHCFA